MYSMEEKIVSEEKLNSVSGGTGSKVLPLVSQAKCFKCGQCRAHCLNGAIELTPLVQVKTGLCNGCGDCAAVCPAGAITMV